MLRSMPRLRHIARVLAIAALVAIPLAALSGIDNAHASLLNPPPPVRDVSPGVGYIWGAPAASLGVGNVCSAGTGGWGSKRFISEPSSPSARNINPVLFTLCEPSIDPATQRFGFGITLTSFKVEKSGCCDSTGWRFGSSAGGAPVVRTVDFVCSTSGQWTKPENLIVRKGTALLSAGGSTSSAPSESGAFTSINSAVTQGNCPFVVGITMPVCLSNNTLDPCVSGLRSITWSAESWWLKKVYSDPSPIQAICSATDLRDSILVCGLVNDLDGTNFSIVCAGAPLASWGDWAWLANWIGHYAQCLFEPMNGFDRTGEAASAWERSPFTPLVDATNDMYDSLVLPTACGQLLHIELVGEPVVVDTCSWTSWSYTLRDWLGLGVTVLGSITVLVLLLKIYGDLFGMGVPDPANEAQK